MQIFGGGKILKKKKFHIFYDMDDTLFAPNFDPSMQIFGGGKILKKNFIFFMTWMIHFLPQILTLVCKIEIL
jgi:hypothetical protein